MTTWKKTARRAAWVLAMGSGALIAPAMAQPAAEKAPAAAAEGKVDAKADEVLDRAVEAMWGDLAESRSIKTMSMDGTLSMPAMGVEGKIKLFSDLENETMKTVVTIPGLMTQTSGVIDGKAYEDSTMTGPRLIEGAEAAAVTREMDLFADVDFRETYSSRQHLGTEQVNGQECDKILLVRAEDGSKVTNWYSKDGLLLKQQETVPTAMGELPATSTMEDYREVGTAQMPFRTVVEVAGNRQVIQFTEITVNEPIAEADLAPPAAVKKLLG